MPVVFLAPNGKSKTFNRACVAVKPELYIPVYVFFWRIFMARVTVEDCVDKIPNRFDLVMLASQRARNLSAGEELTLEQDNDRVFVVVLLKG